MNDADILARLPHARFNIRGLLDDCERMAEEMRNCPPGHERANQLSQQFTSKLDAVRREVDQFQLEPKPAAPVVAQVEGENDDRGASYHRDPDGYLQAAEDANDASGNTDQRDAHFEQLEDVVYQVAGLKTSREIDSGEHDVAAHDDVIVNARKALGMHDEPGEPSDEKHDDPGDEHTGADA